MTNVQIDRLTIQDVVRLIWQTTLDVEIRPTEDIAECREPGEWLVGTIDIEGTWEGTVICAGSAGLVRGAASRMFKLPDEELTTELTNDAMAEITNMVGGNLKGLLPGPSSLGLPIVSVGTDDSVGTRPSNLESVLDVGFLCEGRPLTVRVVEGRVAQSTARIETPMEC